MYVHLLDGAVEGAAAGFRGVEGCGCVPDDMLPADEEHMAQTCMWMDATLPSGSASAGGKLL